jgi:hypothetical protein
MIKHLLITIQILFIFIKSDIIEDCEIGNYCTNGACSTNGNCKIDIFNFTYNPENIGIESICQCNYGFSSYDKDVLKLENSEILCCYEQKSHFTTFMLELFLGLGIGHFYIGDVKYGLVKLFSEIILCFVFCCSTYIACNKEHTVIINLNEIKKDEYKVNENIDNDEIKELNENLENDNENEKNNSENYSKNINDDDDEDNKINDLLNNNVMTCPLYKFFIFASLILFIVVHIVDIILIGIGFFRDGNGEKLAMWL